MTTKLFTVKQVKKFFDILKRLSGSIPIDKSNYPWKDYQTVYTKESNHIPCTREVFVHRTIYKWLKGKYLIIYKESSLGIQYKQYVSITSLVYHNDWSVTGYISVGLLDYAKPYDSEMFGSGEKFNYNTCINLEGEWSDGKIHQHLLKLIMLDIPEKEFIIEIFDWNKYPKRVRKGTDPMDKIKGTLSIKAKTYHEFYNKKLSLFEKEYKGTRIIFGDIIEIKDINNEKI